MSSAQVRKDREEACTWRRTMARPRQQQSLEKRKRKWGSLDPIPYAPQKPEKGAPSKSTLSSSEDIGGVTIQDDKTRVKDFWSRIL